MKPKIMQVVLDLQYVGEKIVAALARALAHEYEVSFCCLDTVGLLGEALRREGFQVEALGRRPGLDRSLPQRIARMARDRGVDIIQAHHYTPFFYSALSRLYNGRPRLIFSEHGRDFPDVVGLKRKLANQLLNGLTHRITVVCQSAKNGLVANDWFPEGKIRVIYNGIEDHDPARLVPDDSCKAVLDFAGDSRRTLGFLARLNWIKHPELLIEAFARAAAQVPDARLAVMGQGELMEPLQALARDRGVADRVFFAGLVTNPYPVLPRLAALVLTSRSEACSLAILEAMMAGVPVIASRVGGNPELVTDGVTGFLPESGDADGFAQAMVAVLRDPQRAAAMGAAARQDALQRFSLEPMVAAFRGIYQELLP